MIDQENEDNLEKTIAERARELTRTRGFPAPHIYAALQIRGMSITDFGWRLGVVYPSAHLIATGRITPGAERRRLIATILDIPESSLWPHIFA